MFSGEFFGVFVTLLVFCFALRLRGFFDFPLFNPVLVSTVVIILLLLLLGVSYEDYFNGGRLVSFFVGPSTVALALPLFRRRALFFANFLPILSGAFFGVLGSLGSVLVFSRVFGLGDVIGLSVLPHGVTTAIATDLSVAFGGIESLTVAAVIMTGVSGAIMGPIVFRVFGLDDSLAQGVCLGTSSHAVGTAKALELGDNQGAMSSLAIVLSGILTSLVFPFFAGFL